jgi:dihydropyrimidinase
VAAAGGLSLVGGTLLDVDGEREANLRIGPDGKIEAAAAGLPPAAGDEVVDVTGLVVVPGGIDSHTHFRLPVGTIRVSDDFESGTRAAAIGGTTTVIDYVTTKRGEDPFKALADWHRFAEGSSVDWGLHMTFTEAVEEATVARLIEAGVSSFKLYMAYPQLLQVDDGVLLAVMSAAARQGGMVTVHCENGGAIEELRRRAVAAGRTAVIEHARTRPAILEGEATARAIVLAELASCPLYIVHVSSAQALQAVRQGRERGVAVSAETCPQYLYLDERRLAEKDGADYVCTPPLRDPWHSEELWRGLAGRSLQVVATDHCPFWQKDRRAGVEGRAGGFLDFREVPGGLPGVETRMALIWQGVSDGRLTRHDWVRLCCEAPAKLFGLWPSKGSLRAGSDGDVVVWDPSLRKRLDAGSLDMATDHSPYGDMTVSGWPARVYLRGKLVAEGGAFVGEPGGGRYIARSSPLALSG